MRQLKKTERRKLDLKRKILSAILAATLIMSMGMVAYAEGAEGENPSHQGAWDILQDEDHNVWQEGMDYFDESNGYEVNRKPEGEGAYDIHQAMEYVHKCDEYEMSWLGPLVDPGDPEQGHDSTRKCAYAAVGSMEEDDPCLAIYRAALAQYQTFINSYKVSDGSLFEPDWEPPAPPAPPTPDELREEYARGEELKATAATIANPAMSATYQQATASMLANINQVAAQIASGNAGANQVASVDMGKYNALSSETLSQVSTANVDVELTYVYEGLRFTILIPKGYQFDRTIPWYGPLYMFKLFGTGISLQ